MKNFVKSYEITEIDFHKFATDASDLGWAPGFFPLEVNTDLGNKQPLILDPISSTPRKKVYNQTAGCISLLVFND